MPIVVEVVAPSPQAASLIGRVFAHFRHVDAVFSTYKPDSFISRLNRDELSIEQAPEVRVVLEACQQMKQRTSGYFDIERSGQIDPSGLVKGWSIQQAAAIIQQAGYQDFFVSAGGDVQAGGTNRGRPWRVGIRHPATPDRFAKLVELTDAAIATSGTYERGQHIYDPKTGRPATALASLSVIGPDIYTADVLATAAFAMGAKGLDFIAGQGLQGYMITAELEAYATAGFAAYETKTKSPQY